MTEYILQFDGASRGNPGKSASAFAVLESYKDESGKKKRRLIYKFGINLGIATNNQAEYMGLFLGLRFMYDNSQIQDEEKKEDLQLDLNNFHIEGDSQLIIKQIKGEYKVKDPELKKIYDNVMFFIKKLNVLTINHIYREFNTIADAECNRILDQTK